MGYALEVYNVSKEYDDFRLHNINFSLEEGMIMGLIGTNGSGKTTLIQIILGLTRMNSGNIKVFDLDLDKDSKRVKDLCGFILDDNPFIEVLNARDNARLFGPYYSKWSEEKFLNYCKQFQVNIKKPIRKLSQGTVIKFQLAFALSHDAKLFIFDEPSAGLDPVFRRELIDIMYDFIMDGERSILFSTHLTNDLDHVADYITMIHKGQQVFTQEKEELFSNYQMVRGSKNQIDALPYAKVVGCKYSDTYAEAMVQMKKEELNSNLLVETPSIEEIMYYMVQGK